MKMKSALLRMAAMAVVVGYVTCECDEGEKPLAVLTYNTGLAPIEPGYDKRRYNVIDALGRKKNNFDFMCLQEVWFESDIQSILDKMGDTMPHHFFAIHQAPDTLQGSAPDLASCTLEELNPFHDCVFANCSSLAPAKINRCNLECREQVYDMNQTCRTCFSVTGQDVENKCLRATAKRLNTLGLLVLSKQPMSDVKFVDYHNGRKVLIQRGYIQAQVGQMTFVCTHLTPVFPVFYDVDIKDLYRDYGEMQRAEINKLGETFNSNSHVLMGNLNAGPVRNKQGQPHVKGEAKENYSHLICGLHYVNPYLRDVGLCTYCSSDNNATWEEHEGDDIVDHVLLSKYLHPTSTKSQRIFTQDKGQLSDHYGISLDMCLP